MKEKEREKEAGEGKGKIEEGRERKGKRKKKRRGKGIERGREGERQRETESKSGRGRGRPIEKPLIHSANKLTSLHPYPFNQKCFLPPPPRHQGPSLRNKKTNKQKNLYNFIFHPKPPSSPWRLLRSLNTSARHP